MERKIELAPVELLDLEKEWTALGWVRVPHGAGLGPYQNPWVPIDTPHRPRQA